VVENTFNAFTGEKIDLGFSVYTTIPVDKNARDNKIAKDRYANPFYKLNQKQTGNEYNLFNLGGI
jgi:hypothetical protein